MLLIKISNSKKNQFWLEDVNSQTGWLAEMKLLIIACYRHWQDVLGRPIPAHTKIKNQGDSVFFLH